MRNAFHASFRCMTPSTSTCGRNCGEDGNPEFDFQPRQVPTMLKSIRLMLLLSDVVLILPATPTSAQNIPSDYQEVLNTLDKKGDFKDGVLKVNVPRNDLKIIIQGFPTPTPFGFGGWIAFTKTANGSEVMMGDLVLSQDEVNPVMSALLDNGIDVTALHNHFFWDDPRVYFMHVHGMGKAADLTQHVKAGLG